MGEAMVATLVTASVQLFVGLLTAAIAIAALSSWRRNALGTRQVELAEECLKAVWLMDEKIKAARMLLPPHDPKKVRDDERVRDAYAIAHGKAWNALRAILPELAELKRTIMLSEIYLGEFPTTRMPHTARFFKMPYKIEQEFDEIIGQLLAYLLFIAAPPSATDAIDGKVEQEFCQKSEMFYGFLYEYEEDDFSVRLRLVKTEFERHISGVLSVRPRSC